MEAELLFNSYLFFAFLVATLLGALFVQRMGARALIIFLIGASLVFYGSWNPRYLIILAALLVLNYLFGGALHRTQSTALLATAIALDLGVLAYFKYANWLTAGLNKFGLWPGAPTSIILPLAISFLTFEQISYLVDCKRRVIRPAGLVDFAFFVTFFPKLIAGPIVRFSELAQQLPNVRVTLSSFAIGGTLFVLGLGKKLLLADTASQYVGPVFGAVGAGNTVGFVDAWLGALAFTFQLYFDFSAYSDMAIGIALIFCISLPINFYSPYKSLSIIDFWRRWHMTLSRFLRDYIYFPLGGSRRGTAMRYVNLIAVMAIGGIWHGAGLTFVAWGLLHGIYLAFNHVFRAIAPCAPAQSIFWTAAGHLGAWLLTFVAVVVSWVFFRAESMPAALSHLMSMFSPSAGGAHVLGNPTEAAAVVALLLLICIVFPNTNQILGRSAIDPGRTDSSLFPDEGAIRWLRWTPSVRWGVAIGGLAVVTLLSMSNPSPFLYFNF